MNCINLYVLTTIACQISECLTEDEIAILSADLMTLGDMLAGILVRKSICDEDD